VTDTYLPVGSPDDPGPGGQVRLRLQVAYDGTAFHGWARQPGLRTVQEELERSLRTALRISAAVPVRAAVAGRTDAGVHARGQVCHADVPEARWLASAEGQDAKRAAAVLRRMNAVLDPDVRVGAVTVAPEGFDARWSAAWRAYRYLVADSAAACDPVERARVLWLRGPLDDAAMVRAAAPFVGEHDFAAYCRPREGASTVRSIHRLTWLRRPDGLLAFDVRADAFCHAMVRSLVGAFLAVGAGRWPEQRPAELLARAERGFEVPTAPAHGLTLVAVGYPAENDLATQAQRSRRWRGR
jgi:tRNA pseudouridine38-40 synthase